MDFPKNNVYEEKHTHIKKAYLFVVFTLALRLCLPRRFKVFFLKMFMHLSFLHFTPQEHFFLVLPFFLQGHMFLFLLDKYESHPTEEKNCYRAAAQRRKRRNCFSAISKHAKTLSGCIRKLPETLDSCRSQCI